MSNVDEKMRDIESLKEAADFEIEISGSSIDDELIKPLHDVMKTTPPPFMVLTTTPVSP